MGGRATWFLFQNPRSPSSLVSSQCRVWDFILTRSIVRQKHDNGSPSSFTAASNRAWLLTAMSGRRWFQPRSIAQRAGPDETTEASVLSFNSEFRRCTHRSSNTLSDQFGDRFYSHKDGAQGRIWPLFHRLCSLALLDLDTKCHRDHALGSFAGGERYTS